MNNEVKDLQNEILQIKDKQELLEKEIINLKKSFFNEYKKSVNQDDIDKINQFKFFKWYYFIPLVGWYIYIFKIGFLLESIDRGFVRKSFYKYEIIYMWGYLFLFSIFCVFFIINYQPIIDYFTVKKINEIYKKEKNL